MKFDRRELLGALSGSILWTACKTVAPVSQAKNSDGSPRLVVRRRWMPSQAEDYKAKYAQAVSWLKSNDLQTFPSEDPRSYLSWKKILQLHQKSCQHSNWFILPWHRLYLIYFESACQIALQDPDFALPYWDWAADRRVPDEFYTMDVLKERRDLAQGQALPEEIVGHAVLQRILASDDFFNFHSYPPSTFPFGFPQVGAFESIPHNGVHNTVGGLMGSTTDSPTDPLFWLHHCNIDRLWDLWLWQHPQSVLPFTLATDKDIASGNTWANTVLSLDQSEWLPIMPPVQPAPVISAGADHRAAASTMKPKDMLQTTSFQYYYDTQTTATLSTAVLPNTSITRTLQNVPGTLSSQSEGLVARIPITTERLQNFKINGAARMRLVLSHLSVPEDAEARAKLRLRFFIADSGGILAEYRQEKAFERSDYLGSHHFFPMGHHAATGTINVGFDATSWLRQRLARGSFTTLYLIVVGLPNLPSLGQPDAAAQFTF